MLKKVSLWLGIVFLAIFLIALFDNPLVGDRAFLETNWAHDIVHLVTGLALILLSFSSEQTVQMGFIVLGIVYGLVALLGFIMIPSGGMLFNFLQMNTADHYLHVIFTAGFLYLGFSKQLVRA